MHTITRTFNKVNSPLFLSLYEFSKEFLSTKRHDISIPFFINLLFLDARNSRLNKYKTNCWKILFLFILPSIVIRAR